MREAMRTGFLEEIKPKQRSRMGAAPVENVKRTANLKSASLGLNPDHLKIWFLGP